MERNDKLTVKLGLDRQSAQQRVCPCVCEWDRGGGPEMSFTRPEENREHKQIKRGNHSATSLVLR